MISTALTERVWPIFSGDVVPQALPVGCFFYVYVSLDRGSISAMKAALGATGKS